MPIDFLFSKGFGNFKQGNSIKILKTIHFDILNSHSPMARDEIGRTSIPKYIHYMLHQDV